MLQNVKLLITDQPMAEDVIGSPTLQLLGLNTKRSCQPQQDVFAVTLTYLLYDMNTMELERFFAYFTKVYTTLMVE